MTDSPDKNKTPVLVKSKLLFYIKNKSDSHVALEIKLPWGNP